MTRVGNCRRVSQRFTTRQLVHDGAPQDRPGPQRSSRTCEPTRRHRALMSHCAGKSDLFAATTTPAVRRYRRAIADLPAYAGSLQSSAITSRSAILRAWIARATPSRSTVSQSVSPTRCIHERDRQALEIDPARKPGRESYQAISVTIARSAPTSALKMLDLPTLGRPVTSNRGRAFADQAAADARRPAGVQADSTTLTHALERMSRGSMK